jgi:two-component system, cell cycle sensor histidine kinase and response regulator CckA
MSESTLRGQNARTLAEAVLEASSDGIVVVDTAGIVLRCNAAAEALFDLPEASLVGSSLDEVTKHPGLTDLTEARIPGPDGAPRTVEIRRHDITWQDEPVHILTFRDVTDEREASGILRSLSAALNSADNSVVIADANESIWWVNRTFVNTTGYRADEVLGLKLPELARMLDLSTSESEIRDRLNAGRSWHGLHASVRKDGSRYHEERTITPVMDRDGRVQQFVSVATDISEWHRAETALRERVKEMSALFRITRELARSDVPLVERLQSIVSILPGGCLNPEATEARIRWHDRDFATDGFQETSCMVTTPIRAGRQLVGQVEVALTEPVPEESGTFEPFLPEELEMLEAVSIGIGDAIERDRLQIEFTHAQRLETVGRLAGGVAHDFNNLLVVIQGLTEMVRDSLPEGSQDRKDLSQVLKAADRGASLTTQLLAFSRKQMLREEVLELPTLVDGLVPMIRRLIPERVTFALAMDGSTQPLRADAAQLEQVILNLVVNAVDAIEGEGRVTLRTATRTVSEIEASGMPWQMEPGCYSTLTITDNGVGMSQEVATRMFEPFFTTKPEGRGTGLGMSMVFGYVKQSRGHILIDSIPGRGTSVELLFPLAETAGEEPPVAPSDQAQDAMSGSSVTILVVEDDPTVRNVLCRMLRGEGHEVLEAGEGREGLEIVEARAGDIDLLISDIVMPGMGGAELAETLRTRWPALRVILMSGYAKEAITRDIRNSVNAFLGKPFSLSAVRAAIAEALR